MARSRIADWLSDPFLAKLHDAIRDAGPLRSISVDITNACNLRCDGCYFFSEGMDHCGGSLTASGAIPGLVAASTSAEFRRLYDSARRI